MKFLIQILYRSPHVPQVLEDDKGTDRIGRRLQNLVDDSKFIELDVNSFHFKIYDNDLAPPPCFGIALTTIKEADETEPELTMPTFFGQECNDSFFFRLGF